MSGSIGGSYSKSKSSSKTIDVTPDEYRGLRGGTAGAIKGLMDGGPQYNGPFAAPVTQSEQNALTGLNQSIAGQSGRGVTYLEDTLGGRWLVENPYLEKQIAAAQRPAAQAYEEARLSDRGAFTAGGHAIGSSSPFSMARARALEGYGNTLSDISTNIAGQDYQAERGRMSQAASQLTDVQSKQLQDQISNLQAQALPRLVAQYGLDQGYAEFQRRVQVQLAAAGLGAQASSIFGNKSSGSSVGYGFETSGSFGGKGK